jgi:dephospho-CoA kinase
VVSQFFSELGVPVIDADVIARELVEPGEPALAAILEVFGDNLAQTDGTLNRRLLRERVFADDEARRRLEAILHPRVRAAMQARLDRLSAPYCVLCVPLLLESGQVDMTDRVLVVDAPQEQQIRRIQTRDGLSREQTKAHIAAQIGRLERLAAADDVIVNDGDLASLRKRVGELHQQYLRRARADLPASDN